MWAQSIGFGEDADACPKEPKSQGASHMTKEVNSPPTETSKVKMLPIKKTNPKTNPNAPNSKKIRRLKRQGRKFRVVGGDKCRNLVEIL